MVLPVYEINDKKYIVERIFQKNTTKTFIEVLYEYFQIPGILEREENRDDATDESNDN